MRYQSLKLFIQIMKFFAIFVIFNILLSDLELLLAIDNTQPRHDVDGKLMDIHDGNVIKGLSKRTFNPK